MENRSTKCTFLSSNKKQKTVFFFFIKIKLIFISIFFLNINTTKTCSSGNIFVEKRKPISLNTGVPIASPNHLFYSFLLQLPRRLRRRVVTLLATFPCSFCSIVSNSIAPPLLLFSGDSSATPATAHSN